MKTENIAPGDTIWSNNEDLLTDENCLPIIGNCQIFSLLSNLDSTEEKHDENRDSDPKTPTENVVATPENGEADKKVPKTGKNTDIFFVCPECPFLCTKNAKMREHLQNAHKTKTVMKLPHLKCPGCTNVFFHKMSLRSHLIHDHGVGNSDLNVILKSVANKAKGCEKKPPMKVEAEKISQSTNGEDSPKCVELPKVEMSPVKAEKIFGKLIGSKKFHSCVVPMCKVTLQNSDNMNYHVTCHKDSGFSCLVCNEFFMSWKQLASHLWRLHKIDMELYSCDQCNYKSVSLAKLNNIHKLIHSDVRAFVCTVCKKAFKNSKQLANHKITHKKDFEKLKLTCETCSKTFSDKRQLKIHMSVVHEKIKPFLCNYCGYKGSSRSSLKMHIRQHTGEKPFTCDSCSYATSDHNSLRRHKWRHTGQKPYKCSFCSYACIQSSTYKVHIKTKHPGQEKDLMFTCQECQFRSVNKEMYVAHMIRVHDQNPQN